MALKKLFLIPLAGLVAVGAFLYLQPDDAAKEATELVAEQQPAVGESVTEVPSAEEFFSKLQQVRQDKNTKPSEPQAAGQSTDKLLSPDDEPPQSDKSEAVVHIGNPIDPELDDPNTGRIASEPISIGEPLDPETYIPAAPADEKEISIGEFIALSGDDLPVVEQNTAAPQESGPVLDAQAEPETQAPTQLQQL